MSDQAGAWTGMAKSSSLDALFLSLTGQEWLVVKHQLFAVYHNVLSWLLVLLRVRRAEPELGGVAPGRSAAVEIVSPGGYERFLLTDLDDETSEGVLATVGYNVREGVNRVPGRNSLVRVSRDGRGLPAGCLQRQLRGRDDPLGCARFASPSYMRSARILTHVPRAHAA